MSQATAEKLNGSAEVNRGLARYANALGHRRGLRRLLGPDVDPEYNLTDFLFKIGQRDTRGLAKVYEAERTKAPLGQTSGPSGGYLVPQPLLYDLMADVAEDALVRPRATIVPMSSSSVMLPLPDAATAPAAAGTASLMGGIKMAWTGEGLTRPETEPTWRSVTLRAWDLTGYALQSNPLYQDGGAGLEGWLRQLFARSIAWYEDFAYFNGLGLGQPMGLIATPAAKVVTRQTSANVTIQDIHDMSKALLPVSWGRAIWVVSPLVWKYLILLNTTAFQINQPIEEGPGRAHFILNGQFGFVSEKLPALAAGATGDVILFDPRLYVIGDRGAVEIAMSEHEPTAYPKNQLVWRVTYRGDGQPQFSKTITLQDNTTTVSPYVVLGS